MERQLKCHAAEDDWPHLRGIPGIREYYSRCLMMRGVAIASGTPTESLMHLLHLYRLCGMGPEDVVWVPRRTGSHYQDILAHKDSREKVLSLVEDGFRFEFFSSSPAAATFIRELGLNWYEHTVNPTPKLFERWRDKMVMRRVWKDGGFNELMPDWQIVHTWDQMDRARQVLSSNGADALVYKVGDRASTEGMQFTFKGSLPRSDFLAKYWDPQVGMIVEAAYEHYPFSVVFNITDEEVVPDYISLQWQGAETRLGDRICIRHLVGCDLSHRGNVVGKAGVNLGGLPPQAVGQATRLLCSPLKIMQNEGYRGMVNVDLASVGPEKVFALEINPRITHSMYVREARESLSQHFGEDLVVIGAKVKLGHLAKQNHNMIWQIGNVCDGNRAEGVLYYLTPLVDLGLGEVGLLAFGQDFETARSHFEWAESRLKAD